MLLGARSSKFVKVAQIYSEITRLFVREWKKGKFQRQGKLGRLARTMDRDRGKKVGKKNN